MKNNFYFLSILTILTIVVSVACGGGGDSSLPFNPNYNLALFAGHYTGSLSGDREAQWTISIDEDGAIVGRVNSVNEITGQVDNDGKINLRVDDLNMNIEGEMKNEDDEIIIESRWLVNEEEGDFIGTQFISNLTSNASITDAEDADNDNVHFRGKVARFEGMYFSRESFSQLGYLGRLVLFLRDDGKIKGTIDGTVLAGSLEENNNFIVYNEDKSKRVEGFFYTPIYGNPSVYATFYPEEGMSYFVDGFKNGIPYSEEIPSDLSNCEVICYQDDNCGPPSLGLKCNNAYFSFAEISQQQIEENCIVQGSVLDGPETISCEGEFTFDLSGITFNITQFENTYTEEHCSMRLKIEGVNSSCSVAAVRN